MEAQVRPGLQGHRAVPEVMEPVEQQVRPVRQAVREVPEPVERRGPQDQAEVQVVPVVPARQVLRVLPEVVVVAEVRFFSNSMAEPMN